MKKFILLLILFEVKSQNIFKLRLPKEVHEFRDLEKESRYYEFSRIWIISWIKHFLFYSFCTTIEINHPIYIYQFDPVLNEETNHISVVSVSPIKENTENSPKTEENIRGFTECTNLGKFFVIEILIHSNLNIVNKSVISFLFTISNNSLYPLAPKGSK